MKKIIPILLFVFILLSADSIGGEVIDTKDETVTVSREINTISIMPNEGWAVIQIKKTYLLEGVPVVGMKRMEFRDAEDDPATEEDETDTSYTDLLNAIKINKQVLKQLIKSKF